jgi:hypothetical protein
VVVEVVTTMATERLAASVSRDAAYERSLEVHRAIEALYPRVEQYGAYFRAVMPVDRSLPQSLGKPVRQDSIRSCAALAIKKLPQRNARYWRYANWATETMHWLLPACCLRTHACSNG